MSLSESESYIDNLNNISDDLHAYFNIISSSIGIPLNLISILIFVRLMRNKNNMGFLYTFQCSIDLLVLLFTLLLFRSTATFGTNLSAQNDTACKLLTFLRRFILHASSWLAVITTFDRFTFVLYGHGDRFRFLKSKRHLIYIILVIFVIIAILDIPNLFFYVTKSGLCSSDFFYLVSSDIISICLRTYFPFLLMLVFNIFMIRKISKNNRSNMLNQTTTLSRKETHFTVAVIAFDVYFFILNFPISLFYIFYDVNLYSGAFKGNALFHAYFSLANNVTADISFCEQTFSFFMYFFCNKLFRNELLSIVGRIFHIQSLSNLNSVYNYPLITIIHTQH